MRKHPQVTFRRIERFISRELAPLRTRRCVPLAGAVHRPAPGETALDVVGAEFAPVEPGFRWGPVWSDAWFRFTAATPAGWQGGPVAAQLNVGCEGIIYDGDDPIQGLDGPHSIYRCAEAAEGGRIISVLVKATGMNPCVSVDAAPQAPPAEPFVYGGGVLFAVDDELDALYHDMRVVAQVAATQAAESPLHGRLVWALNQAVNVFDEDDPETWRRARRVVRDVLETPASETGHVVSAIGHAHIDTAWLWPLERTQQKCIHTFATATLLMAQYPEYRFVCSQAQQYEWVKRLSPVLFERIRRCADAGQWEVAGSMWVEADCNVTGGESLVRQILHGKRFFMAEFGYETRDLWLPDVFGYAASLPQILRLAGIDYFMTQKISWNQTNRFPHSTFLWEGIDGTRILTHFPPADTYNGDMSPAEVLRGVRNFQEHDRASRSLYVYGYGDGGGGPTADMLETARRIANLEGMPKLVHEKVIEFFPQAEADIKEPPVWVGELYLQLHRGTYTTQARNKWWNRKCEALLRDAEFLASVAPDREAGYPRADLERAWKLLLLNQFHDIIPGSSVPEVYADSARDYAEIARIGGAACRAALQTMAEEADTRGTRLPVLVARNYDDRAYGQLVEVPLPSDACPASVAFGDGDTGPVQVVEDDAGRRALFTERTLNEGHGFAVYDLLDTPCLEANTIQATPHVLDNTLLRVEFDDDGLITRIYDRLCDREVMHSGDRGNLLQLFDDRPLDWDAWDIDPYYEEKVREIVALAEVGVVESGPVRGAVRFVRRFGSSRIVQRVSLARDRTRLEFQTEVDWHESHKLLKVAFPVAVHSQRATYEIQYGSVERATHYNTSWDAARFEVAAQRWADLSEGNYGVALLNDSKYGYDVHGNTLRLTLLRSPKAPDPQADMGRHAFTYALLPHHGDYRRGGVIEEAYNLNSPPRALLIPPGRAGARGREHAYFTVDREGLYIEAIKRAEDDDAIIVRLYEGHNTRGAAALSVGLAVDHACRCDLLEREIEPLAIEEGRIRLAVRPFEIVTVKLWLRE